MGFDVYGMNPTVADGTVKPTRTTIKGFGRLSADEKKERMKAIEEYQEKNVGAYFRNNVWWWRPLWNFVTATCDDLLTEKDMEQGTLNGGHKISKTKAGKIAKRLYDLIKDGRVKEYEEGYKEHLASLEQVDCAVCDATGKRQEPPKTGAGDRECNGCNGTGKRDDWNKSYPFSEDNVCEFANFCANSGGFTIC